MWNVKLCMNAGGLGKPVDESVSILAAAGFDGFFVGWKPGDNLGAVRAAAEREHMMFQSVHAPFTRVNLLWQASAGTDSAVREVLDEQLRCLYETAEAGVGIMVTHTFIGFRDHTPTPFDVENYRVLLDAAEKLGVRVALENTEGEEYLDALMSALGDHPALGFCWDSGHEMCYNRGRDLLGDYGRHVICTHLNDNLGIHDFGGKITYLDDLHLLPFDGIADWRYNMSRLASTGFDGPLTFELNRGSKRGRFDNERYARLTPEEYVARAYAAACRVGVAWLQEKRSMG